MTNRNRLAAAYHAFLAKHHSVGSIEECATAFLDAYNGRMPATEIPDDLVAIIATTAKKYGVKPEAIRGRQRWTLYLIPRQEAVWLARQVGYAWELIGQAFGRDHATMMSAYRQFEKLLKTDPVLRSQMEPHRKVPAFKADERAKLVAV